MNTLQNIQHYFKYGRVVHRSPDGKVIRKKVDFSKLYRCRSEHVGTTKTILDKNGNIDHQIERRADIDNDYISSTVRPILYNRATGEKLAESEQPRTKDYLITETEKILTDNTKPGYDYVRTPLPNGKTKYMIAYPETTIINKSERTVVTDSKTSEIIV